MLEYFNKFYSTVSVDDEIYNSEFTEKCNNLVCGGRCCYYGVFLDKLEYENIIKFSDDIKKMMDETQTTDESSWFEKPVEDKSFPSGIAVGTELYNKKCVFLDKVGLCTLHKVCDSAEKVNLDIKPFFCKIFPFIIENNKFTVDKFHLERIQGCNYNVNNNDKILKVCRNEAKAALGNENYKKLIKEN